MAIRGCGRWREPDGDLRRRRLWGEIKPAETILTISLANGAIAHLACAVPVNGLGSLVALLEIFDLFNKFPNAACAAAVEGRPFISIHYCCLMHDMSTDTVPKEKKTTLIGSHEP